MQVSFDLAQMLVHELAHVVNFARPECYGLVQEPVTFAPDGEPVGLGVELRKGLKEPFHKADGSCSEAGELWEYSVFGCRPNALTGERRRDETGEVRYFVNLGSHRTGIRGPIGKIIPYEAVLKLAQALFQKSWWQRVDAIHDLDQGVMLNFHPGELPSFHPALLCKFDYNV
ncbi:hypothetical protein K402DRAFT_397846 [Aulographum hederae CBS 113979]|uniref:Uncharacterized protein n=1 Tax=Aulographum hederae CBS 113979 TaxID=1176131 RepID=A0A6G1GMD0_9PEZI|nr:hypothetical protein K402DRAFT_397846 [Aulographum hederae CBS 113979]